MTKNEHAVTIVIAEDDDDDFLLTKKAFQDTDFNGRIRRVKDGAELMDFLLSGPTPGPAADRMLILLLDLNMPRKDGREALREIKAHPDLKRIPVVVMTTSGAEPDVDLTYELGASSFIKKPEGYQEFVGCISALSKYWLDTVELPQIRAARSLP